MTALSQTTIQPHPQLRKRILGYMEDRTRLHFYIGVSAQNRQPTYLLMPNDRSFLNSILISGPSGSGKSITTRIILENLFIEWKIFGQRWQHPVFMIDSVPAYTPVIVRDDNGIDILPIEDLFVKAKGVQTSAIQKGGTAPMGEVVKTLENPVTTLTLNSSYQAAWNGAVRQIIRHPYKGKLLRLNTLSGLVDVSPNHSVIKTYIGGQRKEQVVNAKTITEQDTLSLLNISMVACPSGNFVGTEELAWLYGLFAAEGWIHKGVTKREKGTWDNHKVIIANSDAKILEKAKSIIERNFHRKAYVSKHYGADTVEVGSKFVYNHFKSHCYTLFGKSCRGKRVPRSILNAPANIKKAFLDGYFAGDGSLTKYGVTFSTNSQCLAMGVIWLRQCLEKRSWSLHVRDDKPDNIGVIFNRGSKNRYPPGQVKKIREIDYEGNLYDLAVKGDHTFPAGVGPIRVHNSKTNYLGLDKPNNKKRDRYLLRTIHPKWDKYLAIPQNLIHVYCPAYVAPVNKKEILHEMSSKWQVEDFWGVPWRHITDLAHLGTVLKVPSETLWVEELRPTFDRASVDPNMTLKGLIGVGGALHKAAKRIRNTASRSAALSFVERWRKNRYWFSDGDRLAEHLTDPFSINVLTFVETPEKIYFNQLAFLIALESLMATLQESKVENQPVIIIHDILNFIGEGKPFKNEVLDALKRLLGGQARTLAHGYIVIIETQTLDIPKELANVKTYTIHLSLNWKSQSPTLRKVPGFIGGMLSIHDHFNNFHRPSVVVRPPLTSYSV